MCVCVCVDGWEGIKICKKPGGGGGGGGKRYAGNLEVGGGEEKDMQETWRWVGGGEEKDMQETWSEVGGYARNLGRGGRGCSSGGREVGEEGVTEGSGEARSEGSWVGLRV